MEFRSMTDWGCARDAGETTWSVGKAGAWAAAYTEFREAAVAMDAIRVTAKAGMDPPGLFRWEGGHGHPVPADELEEWLALTAEGDPYNEAQAIEQRLAPQPEAEAEAG